MKFVLLYRLKEIPIFPRKHPAQRWADVLLKMIERDAGSRHRRPPEFRVTNVSVVPYISMSADEPDSLEIQVSIRGVSAKRHKA